MNWADDKPMIHRKCEFNFSVTNTLSSFFRLTLKDSMSL